MIEIHQDKKLECPSCKLKMMVDENYHIVYCPNPDHVYWYNYSSYWDTQKDIDGVRLE